jgi:acetyl-CoA carboxylase biotin carboxyl carrier protein
MAADDGSKIPSPFDVQTIRSLVALMSRHDLSEIDLREGDLRIRLRRGHAGLMAVPAPVTPPPAPLSHAAAGAPAPATNAEPARAPAKPLHTITCPTPGTFYAAPNPNEKPFVQVGSRVTPTTIVCIIEAMKVLNEVPADCSGVITEILVENQQPVEFNQPLFRVDTSA